MFKGIVLAEFIGEAMVALGTDMFGPESEGPLASENEGALLVLTNWFEFADGPKGFVGFDAAGPPEGN